MSDKRLTAEPQLPALSEFYPGMRNTSWWGLYAPPGLPPAIAARLEQAIAEIVNSPEYKRVMTQARLEPQYGNATQFQKWTESEIAMWTRIAKTVSLKVE